MKPRFAVIALALVVAACTQPAPQLPPVTPSASPSATPSAAPSASVAPSEAPSAAPSLAPTLGLGTGEALKPYGFNEIGGLYRDPARDQLYVIDAQNKTDTPRRFLLRKFQPDGTFLSTVSLAPEGGKVPDAVDGVAFDQRGIPFFNYRENESFSLMKLVTAAVVPVTQSDHPLYALSRAGSTALAPSGSEMLVAAVSLVKDEEIPNQPKETKGGKLIISRAEEGESPSILINKPDPLLPTVKMAFSPEGDLYLAGPNAAGQQALMRIKLDQSEATVATGFPAVPDRMVVAPTGEIVLAFNGTTAPAKLRVVAPGGETRGEVELNTQGNGYLTTVQGLSFDADGRLLVAGRGFNGERATVNGVYRFGRLAP